MTEIFDLNKQIKQKVVHGKKKLIVPMVDA